eukprot:10500715-Alexandrium_andersonii.AAC.1
MHSVFDWRRRISSAQLCSWPRQDAHALLLAPSAEGARLCLRYRGGVVRSSSWRPLRAISGGLTLACAAR